jgi:DNA-directed RNA polymerase subunit K/omega
MSKRVFKVKKSINLGEDGEKPKPKPKPNKQDLGIGVGAGAGAGTGIIDEELEDLEAIKILEEAEAESDAEAESGDEGEEDEGEDESGVESESEAESEAESEDEEEEKSITPIKEKKLTKKSLKNMKQKMIDVISSPVYEEADEMKEGNDSSDNEDNEEYTDDDSEEDSEDEDVKYQKFSKINKKDHILQYHPEILQSNYDEIIALTKVVRDNMGNVIDPLHKTIPILTKYEKTRILGLRAKQINQGAEPFISVQNDIIEGYIIAEMELEKKAIPFIIVRPLPGGKKEYWKVQDLELVDF